MALKWEKVKPSGRRLGRNSSALSEFLYWTGNADHCTPISSVRDIVKQFFIAVQNNRSFRGCAEVQPVNFR
jgi:hypothetical protein